jgi:hypothetical protein
MPEFHLSFFLLGCLGGMLPDVLRIIRNRSRARIPAYLKQGNFWLGLILLICVGGLTAWLLSSGNAKDALIYGYASPQVLSQLAASVQTERVERGVGEAEEGPFNLLKWWRS